MDTDRIQKELEAFERIVPMTTEERKELAKWMKEGFSPFSNPFGLVNLEGGNMVNFIQALKEYPFLDKEARRSGRRYGGSEIFYMKELEVPGWEKVPESLIRARI